MNLLNKIISKIFIFEKEPQKIGLSQFKATPAKNDTITPSIKKKDIKLSDLMRRAS